MDRVDQAVEQGVLQGAHGEAWAEEGEAGEASEAGGKGGKGKGRGVREDEAGEVEDDSEGDGFTPTGLVYNEANTMIANILIDPWLQLSNPSSYVTQAGKLAHPGSTEVQNPTDINAAPAMSMYTQDNQPARPIMPAAPNIPVYNPYPLVPVFQMPPPPPVASQIPLPMLLTSEHCPALAIATNGNKPQKKHSYPSKQVGTTPAVSGSVNTKDPLILAQVSKAPQPKKCGHSQGSKNKKKD